MRARLITRCGCERVIQVTSPPPPTIVLPLRPPRFNEGGVRPWLSAEAPQQYNPAVDLLDTREFKLSVESHSMYQRNPMQTSEVWYDEGHQV
jgi:hypothetical protein